MRRNEIEIRDDPSKSRHICKSIAAHLRDLSTNQPSLMLQACIYMGMDE